jgi:uncharacterized protein
MQVLDADAHVEESLATFADPYWDATFADRRPRIVPRGANAAWLIEDQLIPKLRGAGAQFFASPASVDGRPTASSVRKIERFGDSLPSMELTDVDARLKLMDAENIYLQVIYPTLFLGYPLAEDNAYANALYRSYNSWLADVCRQRPERLRWVSVVNLPDVAGSVAELRRCKELGTAGVMILGTAGERKLDDPAVDEFWAAAEELNLPVSVHVGWPSRSFAAIFDNVYDSLTVPFYCSLFAAFVDVLAGGVLDRHPRLRVAFLEAGSDWLPWLLGRMEHRAGDVGPYYGYLAKRRPREYLRTGNVYFGFEVEDELLPGTLELVGEDYLLFASDIPHGDREANAAADLLKRNDLGDSAKRKILSENTARFYGW